MKKPFLLFIIVAYAQTFAQADTEVFLFDINNKAGSWELLNPLNISNNPGYDNQPFFYNDNLILYSSTRQGQTDVAGYYANKDSIAWYSNTPDGSEYSPLKIPGEKAFSSIRLDRDGTQLLYKYQLSGGQPEVLVKDLKVGYHLWYSKDILITTVLVENRMDLVVVNLKDDSRHTFQQKVGRSLNKIPNSRLVSYISKESEPAEVKSLDPLSGATEKIVNLPAGVEDMCWLLNGTILIAKANALLTFKPGVDEEWREVMKIEDDRIHKISRLAVNSISSKLALVAESSAELVVQKQLDAYNARDIDAFVATYSDDIKLYNFPENLRTEGKDQLRQQYGGFFEATPDLKAEIQNRIVLGNKVIDEELVTVNGNQFRAVAIYEVSGGKITKVTFIQ